MATLNLCNRMRYVPLWKAEFIAYTCRAARRHVNSDNYFLFFPETPLPIICTLAVRARVHNEPNVREQPPR